MTDQSPTFPFPPAQAPQPTLPPAPQPTTPAAPFGSFSQPAPLPVPAPALAPAPAVAAPQVTPAPAPVPEAHAVEDPEPDTADEQDVDTTAPEPASPLTRREARRDERTPKPAKTRDRDKERERALVRRTAGKFQDLLDASDDERALLAGVLGVSPTVYELTVAIVTGGAKDIQAATDALTIIDADEYAAAVEAAALGRPRLKAVWQLAHRAELLPADVPAADAKAAIALARALHSSDDFRTRVESAVARIKA